MKKVNFRKEFNFQRGETFQRMNYLLQLSNTLYETHPELSRTYISMMKSIRKKNALRLYKFYYNSDPYLKNMLCDSCNNLLYRDQNSEISVKSRE
jgi:RNase P subunit RPR2